MNAGAEAPESSEVLHVERIGHDHARLLGTSRLLRFDQHRQAIEPRVGEDAGERFEAEAALSDVLVPIHAAPARFLRIVRVERAQAIDADDAVEGGERFLVTRVRNDVVTGSGQMAGVQADAHVRRAIQVLHDRREMLEAMPHRAALSCGVLEEHHRLPPRFRAEGVKDPLCDESQRVRFATGCARAGMNDDPKQAERVGSIELVDERSQ
jgi:hypothetical protein